MSAWLSVAEAARLFGVSESHVRRHAPLRRVGRRVLVPVGWVILRRLSELQSLVVQATGYDPLRIQQANVGETVRARPTPRRLFSSVDGVLRVLTGGDTTVWAGLREHRTNRYVRCSFDAATWKDRLGPLWEHRVIVEGMVAYDDERRPRSIIDIKRVTSRQPGRHMSELGGTAPGLTGGIDDNEFVALIRGRG